MWELDSGKAFQEGSMPSGKQQSSENFRENKIHICFAKWKVLLDHVSLAHFRPVFLLATKHNTFLGKCGLRIRQVQADCR